MRAICACSRRFNDASARRRRSLHMEDGLMLEGMLRDALEMNVPGYKDYRNTIIDEWVRQQVEQMALQTYLKRIYQFFVRYGYDRRIYSGAYSAVEELSLDFSDSNFNGR